MGYTLQVYPKPPPPSETCIVSPSPESALQEQSWARTTTENNPVLPVLPQALLALADGTVFSGNSIGSAGHTVGEVVFNTSLTGYQEILTDPSYCQQIVTLTYPHIGNYGVNPEDVEASKVHASGLK